MSRSPIVAGNWKMHGSIAFVHELLAQLLKELSGLSSQVVIFPPFTFLELVGRLITNSQIEMGAQNIHGHESGAFTGEIAAPMVKEMGCQYTLVGHSERRTLFGETSELVARKFEVAQKAKLVPVLCVGESLAERQQSKTRTVVAEQIEAVLEREAGVEAFRNAIIAYEPVWAIGTGESATPEIAEDVHQFIRGKLAEKDGQIAQDLRILYGGSVSPGNAELLFKQENVDGALVGGASLKGPEFVEICRISG